MRSKWSGGRARVVPLLASVAVLLFATQPLFAEPYGGGFLGGTIPADVDIKEKFPAVTFEIEQADVDSSFAGGLKLGYWLDGLPYVGFESGLDFYLADVPSQVAGGIVLNTTDVFVTAWEFTLMGRLPLEVSHRYPRGRFHPYLGLGPGIFFVTGERGSEDSDTVVGLQLLAGLKAFLSPNLALFFEYKYHAFTPKFDVFDPLFGNGKDEFKYRVNMLVIGIAYHF